MITNLLRSQFSDNGSRQPTGASNKTIYNNANESAKGTGTPKENKKELREEEIYAHA